jgi:hypothetical protein
MKTPVLKIVALFIISFYTSAIAQNFSCADFTIQSIAPDTTNPGILQIGISFNASSGTFANYPHVATLLDCNGDTAGTGSLFVFGQFGQTVVDYPVNLSGTFLCQPLTAVLVFTDNAGISDTCLLSFTSTSVINSEKGQTKLTVYPNPAHHEVVVEVEPALIGTDYYLCDYQGRNIAVGMISQTNMRIDIRSLSSGVYFIRAGENGKFVQKVIKE